MQYALLTMGEFRALYEQMRDPQQLTMPDGGGAVHVGRHPLYERVATIHDGERIGFLASRVPACLSAGLGHLSDAMKHGGPAWASLVALGAMLQGAG